MAALNYTADQLDNAISRVRQSWHYTAETWNDKKVREFETDYWAQLEAQVAPTSEQMRRLAAVIAAARQNVR